MKKIPSVFKRNYKGNRQVYIEVVEGCEWVLEGEGIATVKHDGTACMVRDGILFKRYDAKKGRTPPEGFEPTEPERNEHTGHWPGWVPVGEGTEDQYHREAFEDVQDLANGTYELIGPKIQGNPHRIGYHKLVLHGFIVIREIEETFEDIREWLKTHMLEGIVWHHPDGRMAKIKRRDFGFDWPVK